MAAGKLNFIAEQNADFAETLAYLESDKITPIDITGATFKMEVREGTGKTVVLELSTANGRIVITDAANGRFSLTALKSIMETLAPNNYKYDLLITLGGGDDRLRR